MKMKFWLMTFGAMISASLLAQPSTNMPAPSAATPTITTAVPPNHTAPPPARRNVVKKPAVKKPAKPIYELRTIPLVPGPAVVAANRVNVRTRPSMVGEVVTRMTNGEAVMVIDEIRLKHSGPDEPSAWAKIVLPPQSVSWVKASYIDSATKAVTVKKLNVRGGPGENYGVIGTLAKGDVVDEIITQGEWTKITSPANGYAFMAAQYLKQGPVIDEMPAPTPEPTPTPEPAPTPTTVTETPGISPTTGEMTPPVVVPNDVPPTAPMPAPDEPKAPRVVTHEGVVRGTISIQAPTPYALIAPDTGETVNYLYTKSKDLDLSRYKGLHIIVSGEESLDSRWPHTPLITIQKIQVID